MRLSLSRPTPAFLLALFALVFAMAGTGYAASQISGNIIKKRSIPGNRVAVNALTGAEVKESSLGIVPRATAAFSADTAASADTAKTADLATTATSAKSADTALVADKAKDADKLGGRLPSEYLRSTRTVRSFTLSNIAVNNGAERSVFCEPGEIAVGGGAGWYIAGTDEALGSSTLSVLVPVTDPATNQSGFRGEGKNTTAAARDFKVFAVCIAAG